MSKAMALLAAFTALILSTEIFSAPPAEWGFQKFPAAMAEAKTTNEPVFVLFGSETCLGCKKLYSQTLSDDNLRKTFQKNFVLAYVDTDGRGEPDSYQIGDGPALSRAELRSTYKGNSTPSWAFLTKNGVRLHGDRGGNTMVRELLRDSEIALEKFNKNPGSDTGLTVKPSP